MRNWFFRDHGHAGRRRGVVVCSGDDDSSSPLQPSPLSTSPSGGGGIPRPPDARLVRHLRTNRHRVPVATSKGAPGR